MMCDAIRLVEDDVVHTMSMNSSDDDESFQKFVGQSVQQVNVVHKVRMYLLHEFCT